MIESIYSVFWPQMIMLLIVYLLVLVMIFLDLWSGVRKARHRKEFRSSYGYRETVKKIAQYYNTLFVITVIDVIQMLAVWQLNQQAGHHLPIIPLLTFGGAIFIGLIELKSIYEKAEDKEKARATEAAALLGKVLKDRDTQEIVTAMIEHLGARKQPTKKPVMPNVSYLPNSHTYDETEE